MDKKDTKKAHRLVINKRSLRNLSADRLREAVGGMFPPGTSSQCSHGTCTTNNCYSAACA
jgi:hypothetical protein